MENTAVTLESLQAMAYRLDREIRTKQNHRNQLEQLIQDIETREVPPASTVGTTNQPERKGTAGSQPRFAGTATTNQDNSSGVDTVVV